MTAIDKRPVLRQIGCVTSSRFKNWLDTVFRDDALFKSFDGATEWPPAANAILIKRQTEYEAFWMQSGGRAHFAGKGQWIII